MTFKYLESLYESEFKRLIDAGYDREDRRVVRIATVLMAIKKQVAQDAVVRENGVRSCPRCKHDFYKMTNHCPECGQKVRKNGKRNDEISSN